MKNNIEEFKNLIKVTKSMDSMRELTDSARNNLISFNKLTNEMNKQTKFLIYEIGYNLLKDNVCDTQKLIDDTINAAGISIETFYYYFKIPASFIYEIIVYKRNSFKERLNKMVSTNGSIEREDLKLFISDFAYYKDIYDFLDDTYIYYISTKTSKSMNTVNFYESIGNIIFNNVVLDMRNECCRAKTIANYLKTISFFWNNNDISNDEIYNEDKNDTIKIMIDQLINYIYN